VDCSEIAQRFARDRHFSTRAVLGGWDAARAGFVVREQAITVAEAPTPWRRVELALHTPTKAGEAAIRLWSNLPEEISAAQIAALYRTRWRVERSPSPAIEGMFQRLERVLHSEIRSRSHPRAALLRFAVALLAYNVLALLQRCVEQVHWEQEPPPEVSTYHLALRIRSSYEGPLITLPPEQWPSHDGDPTTLADRLLRLARNIDPRQGVTSNRGPKITKTRGYVDRAIARAHVSTARVLAQA